MAIRHNVGFSRGLSNVSTPTPGGEEGSSPAGQVIYGRVVDVILDMSHKRVKSLGGTQALYGIFYQPLFVAAQEDIPDYGDRFAYCGCQTIRQIPIKGEIVKIVYQVAGSVSESSFNSDGTALRAYWTEIVPVWNHPHLNVYPDSVKLAKEHQQADLGKDFKEDAAVRPLQLNAGDVSIEGRHGNSIRLGGTQSSNSTIAKDVNGKPYIIIRNGQKATSGDTVYEDVNDDDSSIYLTSDHKVPITEANRWFRAARKAPEAAAKYQGKQIVGNSDRILFNAKKDNLILAASKHASINAESVSIDGKESGGYVGLNAEKVYLGEQALEENEPVLKGTTTVEHLDRLYSTLITFFQQNAAAFASAGMTPWEKGVGTSTFGNMVTRLQSFKSQLPRLKSKKVYTE